MVPERGLARVGGVHEGVALVEAPPWVDADPLGAARGRDLQFDLEGDLESRGDHSGIRIRVVQERPVAHTRQDDGAAPAVRLQVAGQGEAQLLVRAEGRCRVGPGNLQEIECVAGDEEGTWALGPFEGAGEHHRRSGRGVGPLWSEEQVAHDDHSPTDGHRQARDLGVGGHVPPL